MQLDRLILHHYIASTLLAIAGGGSVILAAVADNFPLVWLGLALLLGGCWLCVVTARTEQAVREWRAAGRPE